MQGKIVFAAGGTGNFAPGDTVTGTGFSAKAQKWNSTTRELTVYKITGNVTSGLSITNGAGATWVADTVTSATLSAPAGATGLGYCTGGWNIRETDSGITRSSKAGSRIKVEVLTAVKDMATNRGDFAVVATFTLTGGAWSAATTYDVSNGESITFSIKSSEPTQIPSGTTYAFDLTGKGAKTATFVTSSSDFLTHTFGYTVVTGDIGATGATVTTGNFTIPAGKVINEVAADGTVKAITAPVAVGGTLAAKTGVTVQA
jgi:hypothetical protein